MEKNSTTPNPPPVSTGEESALLREAMRLDTFLDGVDAGAPLWSPGDLEAILRHQWQAPITMDLQAMRIAEAQRLTDLSRRRGLTLNSFGELLTHPCPPVELLEMTKEFAKRNLASPSSALPPEVARVLYVASIAAAAFRCRRRISTLNAGEMLEGIDWSLNREWLVPELRELLAQARVTLCAPGQGEGI